MTKKEKIEEKRFGMMNHFHKLAISEEQQAWATIKCEPTAWKRDTVLMLYETCPDYVSVIDNGLRELERLRTFKKTFDEYELSKKQDFIAYENWQECEKVIKTTIDKIKLRIEGNKRILNTKVNNWLSSQLKVQNTTLELVLMLLGDEE